MVVDEWMVSDRWFLMVDEWVANERLVIAVNGWLSVVVHSGS